MTGRLHELSHILPLQKYFAYVLCFLAQRQQESVRSDVDEARERRRVPRAGELCCHLLPKDGHDAAPDLDDQLGNENDVQLRDGIVRARLPEAR